MFEKGVLYPGNPKAKDHNIGVMRARGNTFVLYSFTNSRGDTQVGTAPKDEMVPDQSPFYDGPKIRIIKRAATEADLQKYEGK